MLYAELKRESPDTVGFSATPCYVRSSYPLKNFYFSAFLEESLGSAFIQGITLIYLFATKIAQYFSSGRVGQVASSHQAIISLTSESNHRLCLRDRLLREDPRDYVFKGTACNFLDATFLSGESRIEAGIPTILCLSLLVVYNSPTRWTPMSEMPMAWNDFLLSKTKNLPRDFNGYPRWNNWNPTNEVMRPATQVGHCTRRPSHICKLTLPRTDPRPSGRSPPRETELRASTGIGRRGDRDVSADSLAGPIGIHEIEAPSAQDGTVEGRTGSDKACPQTRSSPLNLKSHSSG